jgi:hydroxymethylpyrimidine pyrophosphatase-like HAD family hydrolase
VAIGDNDNDVSMLQCAGLGIAVNNATKKLKNCADVVTKASNDQNAIVEAIKIIS